MAHDRQAEAGAAGLAAAALVDAVEALEDAFVVLGRDADTVVGNHQLDPRALDRTRTWTVEPESLYLTTFSTRLPNADTSWRRSPSTCTPAGARAPRWRRAGVGQLARPFDGTLDASDTSTTSRTGSSPSSIRDSSRRSSMMPTAVRFVDHAAGDPVDDAEVVLVGHRLGEQGQRPDGRLQLVADVGHEVGAHRIDPAAFADVLDRRHRPTALERAARTTTATRAGRTARGLARLLTIAGGAQHALDGVVDEHAHVRALERPGGAVAVVDGPDGR